MWHLRKTSYPDRDKKERPGDRTCGTANKRKRRSLSGAPKNKRCKRKSPELPNSCPENRSVNEREHLERHYAEEYRNEYNRGWNIEHLSNKFASGMKKKYQTPYTTCHPWHLQKSHRRKRPRTVEDDEEGHLICQSGDVLIARYEVVAALGKGTYGKVVECIDHKAFDVDFLKHVKAVAVTRSKLMAGRHVAVKIAKNIDSYSEAAHSEIWLLHHLNTWDPSSTYRCVKMLDWFEYHGHVCIVFELLGLSTYDFMKLNHFLPLRMEHIRHIAYQICTSVNFLHQHKLTHTDLKPENILFVNSDYTKEYIPELRCDEHMLKNPDIKIVDFGCATFDDESHCLLVSTRQYRAPEVILALGWSQPCDVWSIGCILLEYYLGETVFEPDNSKEHLAMMERVLGRLPKSMIKKTRKREYFRQERLDWDKRSRAGCNLSLHYKPLKKLMMCHDADHKQLFDLIGKMLQYDPHKRITLEKALEHPFFFPLKQQAQGSLPSTQ